MSATEFHLFKKRQPNMHLFGNKIHANDTKAHLCSSFTPLIAKPKTTKHNNLSKYRRQKILPLKLKM